jgi:hypothetical protein
MMRSLKKELTQGGHEEVQVGIDIQIGQRATFQGIAPPCAQATGIQY